LNLSAFLAEYRRYAEQAGETGFIRYEDFCETPARIIRNMCQALDVAYDDRFMEWYPSYTKITGDVFKLKSKRNLAGDRAGDRARSEIRKIPRRAEYGPVAGEAKKNADYAAIMELLGYPA
jgi:hypothetical protein